MPKCPLLCIVLPLLLFTACTAKPTERDEISEAKAKQAVRIKQHAAGLKQYAALHHANTRYGILVDMSIKSWKRRLFLVDLETDSVLVAGICAHGQCDDIDREDVKFSNTIGSNCTAEGHYKIGSKYTGQYGDAYRLYGLDTSNSNAAQRIIVYHYYTAMNDFEDKATYRSNGCPMVAEVTFRLTEPYIDRAKAPVLLWIYK